VTISKWSIRKAPFFDEHFEEFWKTYHALTERKGVSPDYASAKFVVVPRSTVP
jgi:hypothetical protein